MVQFSLQNSAGEVVFYAWVPRNPPLGTNGSKSTLVTLGVFKLFENTQSSQFSNQLNVYYGQHYKVTKCFCLKDWNSPINNNLQLQFYLTQIYHFDLLCLAKD